MTQILPLDHTEQIPAQPKAYEADRIITMGEVIGMLNMVLASIIEAIEKSGNVGKNYLETNLIMMRDTAAHAKKAQQDKAQGMRSAAVIGIVVAGAGVLATAGAGYKTASDANKMSKINSAPLTEPSKVGAAANHPGNKIGSIQGNLQDGKQIADLNQQSQALKSGNSGAVIEASPSKQPEAAKGGDKALHAKDKNATSYATEAERERAMKIQERLNNKPDPVAIAASMVNPHVLQVGSIEQARKDDDAADADYVAGVERANSDAIATLKSENANFYGALSGMLDKLAIANVVTQELIASSQMR